MDKRLIWSIKSSYIIPSRKNLIELSLRPDLFDETTLNPKDKKYKMAVSDFEKAQQRGISIVTFIDENYPTSLKELSRPPRILYVDGNPDALNYGVYAGIVGCRKCDDYGLRMATQIAQQIGETGAGIVSGGAEGVDAASHRGALLAGAPTICVLGSGFDELYPACNKELFKEVAASNGAVISEFSFSEKPLGRNFPHRNRIIAALSSSVAVIRAGRRSGALITANMAVDMNKTVFALPGNIDHRLSIGTNALIRDGAVPLLSAMDIIDELIESNPDFFMKEKPILKKKEEKQKVVPFLVIDKNTDVKETLSEYEKEIINIIKSGHTQSSQIEEQISFEPSRLTAVLGLLEIKGLIKRGRDKKYKLTIEGGF